MKRLFVLCAAAVLAGCGHSPPTRFFTVEPTAPATRAAEVRMAPVQLDAVHIPAVLDRPQIVTRAGPGRLELDDQDQWGAPFGQVLRQALAKNLLARLPAGTFVLPEAPRPADARGLVVNVLELQGDGRGAVRLQASWSLLDPSGKVMLTRDVQLSAPAATTGAPAEAAAISRLTGELADQIAAVLTGAPS
jgi:uncharacterized lipoprotein YmbA